MSVERAILPTITERIGRTRLAVRLAFQRRDSTLVFLGVGLGYLMVYLWVVQDLRIRRDVEPGLLTVDNMLATALRRTGPASFERIAMIDTGVVRWMISPGNTAIGLGLAALVGISLALTYLAIVQPRACGLGAGSGVLAAIPALLGGTVCCGPVLAFVLGIQLTSVTMTAFAWLLPLAVAMMVGSAIYIGGKIQVEQFEGGTPTVSDG